MSRGPVIAAAVGAALLGAIGVFLVLPDTGPDLEQMGAEHDKKGRKARRAERARPEAPEAPARVQARGDKAERPNRAELRRRLQASPKVAARVEQLRELRALEGEEKAGARGGMRAERLESNEQRVRKAAESVGWDEGTTAQVIEMVEASHAEVSDIMAAVDLGDKTWEEARPEMREVREAQANELREMLGDDGYRAFTDAMAPSFSQARGRQGVGPRPAIRPGLRPR